MYDIAIIGGGASGLLCAIQAKRLRPALRIAVLERQSRVGKKLLATGNGRCNLTNLSASETDYHGGTQLMIGAMRRYPPSAVIEYFRTLGVEPLFEGDKVYPQSEQASSVLDALRLSLLEMGIEPSCDVEVTALMRADDHFQLGTQNGAMLAARSVIVSAGSLSSPSLGGTDWGHRLLKGLGHRIVGCHSALVQLQTPVEPIRALSGIKFNGNAAVLVNGNVTRIERGEVLFTNYGLSGPPILQLSRAASVALAQRKAVAIRLSIMDDPPLALLRARRQALRERPLEHFLTGMLNKRIGQTLLKLSGCVPFSRQAGSLTDFEIETLAGLMACWELPVTGTQGFKGAQVAAGGADTAQFDPLTLQSRLCPNLYATGEVLDIDGDCGGFNLQWAWASALLAGECAARGLV